MTDSAFHNVAGVVLAGGLSRRMDGRDKALIPLGGRPMIAHVLERLAPQVDAIAINANGDPARFATFGVPVLADTIPGHAGPLAGILTAMRWARESRHATHVVTAAADTPFFPPDLVSRLRATSADQGTIVMARSPTGSHPVFALWPVALADDLETWIQVSDTLKVTAWAGRHASIACDFTLRDDGYDPFFNVNTQRDLDEAEAMLQMAKA
ncbi:molybdenum cofactor guanylyltransferase MobA [Oricola sp.]|uniref:molybdenum cofactor guanylyltransferase MobA n=1 Tax=Oricola sp. TaxID=1979950 RepID=UPI0025ED9802|nr:molybdenum cofactor guanylyltransferase MobA [Oricola sp.]MCI5077305.1 molybdenum cofactor guanylyltransferase MobA [Oricola sp.]